MNIRGPVLNIALAAALPLPVVALLFARDRLIVFAIAGLVSALFAAAAAVLTARNLRRRLERLDAALTQIGEGDFSARLPESAPVGDEIAALNKSFNSMAVRVSERRNRFVELDTLKSDFVSSVSHELRTPLTTIKALTRLLMRGEAGEEKRREYLQTISVECDRQIDLVLNLLDLSRIEGGVFRLAMEKVDVADVIRLCVRSETSAAERRMHKLGIEPITQDIPPVYADPKALRRVLSNLIENAIKYTPDGGSITIFAREDGDFVSIGVTDNGRGIPAEDLPILFDKFHRGSPAAHSAAMRTATEDAALLEDADVSGVGLGLYLAKTVTERMGGSISVETELGRGSTFVLSLPVWRGELSLERNNGEAPVDR